MCKSFFHKLMGMFGCKSKCCKGKSEGECCKQDQACSAKADACKSEKSACECEHDHKSE